MENKSNSSISFLLLLSLVFSILKLCGVIDWSWWWITAPLWGGFAVLLVVLPIVGVIALWISVKKRERKPTFIDRLKKAQAEQKELLKQYKKK